MMRKTTYEDPMGTEYLIDQVESYQRTLGRKPSIIKSVVKKTFQVAGVYIGVAMALFGVGGLVIVSPSLTMAAAETGYALHLRFSPLPVIKFFSDEDAEWLGEIRDRGCPLDYFARLQVEKYFTGQANFIYNDDYWRAVRCFDPKRRNHL